MIKALSLALALLCASPAAAATIPATSATLAAALKAAQPGDTVVMTGAFDHVLISGKTWSPSVTFDATAATFANFKLQASAGVILKGGAFKATAWDGAVYCIGSQNFSISGIRSDGAGLYTGVVFRNCSGVSLTGSVISGPNVGVQVIDSQNVTISGNELLDASADDVTITSSQTVGVTLNLCAGSSPVNGVHPDCVQIWSNTGDAQSADIKVTGNQAYGNSQGFDDFGGDHRGAVRLDIEDNTVDGSYPQGVAVSYSPGAAVKNNHVRTLPASTFRTSVNIIAPGAVTCGNTADAGAGKAAWADAPCPAAK